TEQELREIGVPLGHRLRMLRAIRGLTGKTLTDKTLADQTLIAGHPALAEAAAREGAERRHMTVMFCELIGLGALTAKLDPEDMADLIRAAQGAIAAVIARLDGHVAKWVGDGATIYFGYPRAHEDDAERAARAGLALIEAVAKLGRSRGVTLDMRIGISSG